MTRKKQKTTLAENIIERRTKRGWSAMELAERAQIPYPTLRNIEADISRGTKKTLEPIAQALECSFDELFQKREKPSPSIVELAEVISELNKEIEMLKQQLNNINSRASMGRMLPSDLSKALALNVPIDVLKLLAEVYPEMSGAIQALLGVKKKHHKSKINSN